MNVMLICPTGNVFIGSIHTTSYEKTKKYIMEELKSYIEAVGLRNMKQIYLDIASAMLGALDELVTTYPHLYKQGCCAYILDLLLKIGKKKKCLRP
jgi:hypothetical protein